MQLLLFLLYREILHNINSTFNDNGTISYTQRRYIEFIRDLSIGDPHVDTIISPNIPLVVSETPSTSTQNKITNHPLFLFYRALQQHFKTAQCLSTWQYQVSLTI